MTVAIDLPQDVLDSARLSAEQAKQELAIALYAQGRLSIGKAHELAGMSLWQFRQMLGSLQIEPHVDVSDLEEDLQALHDLGRM
jgi:predicted HTH domain antitoxin